MLIAQDGAVSIKLRKDHIELVKFNANTDMDYRIVLSQLRAIISALRAGDMKTPTEEDVAQFLEMMTVAEPEAAEEEEEAVEVMEEKPVEGGPSHKGSNLQIATPLRASPEPASPAPVSGSPTTTSPEPVAPAPTTPQPSESNSPAGEKAAEDANAGPQKKESLRAKMRGVRQMSFDIAKEVSKDPVGSAKEYGRILSPKLKGFGRKSSADTN